MKIVNQILDYTKRWTTPDVYLFTGNSTFKHNGALVMGRGAALMCKNAFPGIDAKIGTIYKDQVVSGNYYVLFAQVAPKQLLGVFQVKHSYADRADIELIKRSTALLKQIAEAKNSLVFHMNYPGIGYGGLDTNLVDPIIRSLPDNVFLYRT